MFVEFDHRRIAIRPKTPDRTQQVDSFQKVGLSLAVRPRKNVESRVRLDLEYRTVCTPQQEDP